MKRGSGVLIYTPKAYIYGVVYIFGTYIFGVEGVCFSFHVWLCNFFLQWRFKRCSLQLSSSLMICHIHACLTGGGWGGSHLSFMFLTSLRFMVEAVAGLSNAGQCLVMWCAVLFQFHLLGLVCVRLVECHKHLFGCFTDNLVDHCNNISFYDLES